ncbi:hypothetical protein AX774_g2974 [Zancudomyces culisetae]|uniref:Gamma-butyrobetaine hydroxylase-like N-terminal domain-containing protein n=1 Tax=Zancudomyces culisetae TaxID=1213189 RepID=A0A1R1PRI3_ZANCU|nr:hypothetical protein AX774_g2974 [Zancudomyces culisetae]|eukprot:OMH83503.1 hypothetical protein AX774_g2974 [Zancudomyces culisetae]
MQRTPRIIKKPAGSRVFTLKTGSGSGNGNIGSAQVFIIKRGLVSPGQTTRQQIGQKELRSFSVLLNRARQERSSCGYTTGIQVVKSRWFGTSPENFVEPKRKSTAEEPHKDNVSSSRPKATLKGASVEVVEVSGEGHNQPANKNIQGSAKYQLPTAWLRDNCMCSLCVHSSNKQKLHTTGEISRDLQVKSVKVEYNKELQDYELEIEWVGSGLARQQQVVLANGSSQANSFSKNDTGNHVSKYALNWLKTNLPFPQKSCEIRQSHESSVGKVYWDRKMYEKEHEFVDYNDYMSSTGGYTKVLEMLGKYGLAFIKNIPENSSTANGNGEGEDPNYPKESKILQQIPVTFHYKHIETGEYRYFKHPTLKMSKGAVKSVFYSPPFQGPLNLDASDLEAPIFQDPKTNSHGEMSQLVTERITEFYDAFSKFENFIHKPENTFIYRPLMQHQVYAIIWEHMFI